MTTSSPSVLGVAESPSHPESHGSDPRSDVLGGLMWMGLGIVILVASWRMDRLEQQDINPYTIPGLVPGLLGAAMVVFATLMLGRGWRRGGLRAAAVETQAPAPDYGRLAIVLLLCVGYAVLLLGHVAFWIASSGYVATSIMVLRFRELKAADRLASGIATAIVVGLGAGVVVSLVFERIFLVRLP